MTLYFLFIQTVYIIRWSAAFGGTERCLYPRSYIKLYMILMNNFSKIAGYRGSSAETATWSSPHLAGRDVVTCLMPDSELKSQLLAKDAERKRTTSPKDSPRQKQRWAAEVHVEELDDL
ncbi:hypothetical protein V8C86DRAFT_2595701, partial [Haematococcus lacustris]